MRAYKTTWPTDDIWEGALLVKDSSRNEYLVLTPRTNGFSVMQDQASPELDAQMNTRPDFTAVEVPDSLPELIRGYLTACDGDSKSDESSAYKAVRDALGPDLMAHILVGCLPCPA